MKSGKPRTACISTLAAIRLGRPLPDTLQELVANMGVAPTRFFAEFSRWSGISVSKPTFDTILNHKNLIRVCHPGFNPTINEKESLLLIEFFGRRLFHEGYGNDKDRQEWIDAFKVAYTNRLHQALAQERSAEPPPRTKSLALTRSPKRKISPLAEEHGPASSSSGRNSRSTQNGIWSER